MATMTIRAPSEQAGKVPKRRGVWLLLLLVVGVIVAVGWWGVHPKGAAETGSSQSQWVVPELRTITSDVNATGTVKLKTGAEVRVGAQLSGIVRRLNVKVGSHVIQGDVIAEIDSRPVTARIDQARAQLAQAKVSQSKAQTDFERTQKLIEAGLVPAQQFDDAKASLEASEASVAAAQSGLAAAQVDLAYVDIRAPISGTIASISTQQGETVAASFATPTFVTIIQEAALEVIAMVDEADIGNVRRGEKVAFTTETFPDHEFQGSVTRIAPVATIISGVVNYEVANSIQRDIALLKPDMTANVNIQTSQHQAVLIPTECLHKDGSLSFVYVQRAAGAPEKRVVSVGARIANETEIVRGLGPNDRIQSQTGVPAP